MTTLLDPHSGGIDGEVVAREEPPRRTPPLLVVGPIAWVRNNLFRTWVDTLLTFLAALITVGVVTSFLTWAIGQADWFAVIFNLRLLLLGRFPVDAEWRVVLLTVITAFTIGMGLAAWTRIRRSTMIVIAVFVALLFVIPPVINASVPSSASYMAAGNVEIASGSSVEVPQTHLGFIAQAGETVTVRFADQFSGGDQPLTLVSGFSDKATSLLANGAANRQTAQQRSADLNARLASDSLTAGQRTRLTTQLERLTIPEAITDTYPVNQGAIQVSILDGVTLESLGSATISSDSEPLSVTLPADGWYVLEKLPADDSESTISILEVTGIEPILERQLTRTGDLADDGSVSAVERISQYVRMRDAFNTEALRPEIDGGEVPMVLSIDNGYRGMRTFADFLRLYIAPFFDAIKETILVLVVAVGVGYAAGQVIDRVASPAEKPRKSSRRATTWLVIALPVLMFGLVYGVGSVLPLTDTRRWGGLLLTILLTIVSIVASFPLGILLALGRRSHMPVVSAASTLYIEFVRGVPLITVLFMAQLLVPLVNPSLAGLPNVFRAMIAITLFNAAYLAENVRGGLQSVPHGQEEAAKALGLSSLQITLYITLPQALRAILPALVGMVISVYKDTSLVAIVGLLDLTGMAQNIVTQTEFIGLRRETLVFITIVYFVGSYVIAAVSRKIEMSGAGAARMRLI